MAASLGLESGVVRLLEYDARWRPRRHRIEFAVWARLGERRSRSRQQRHKAAGAEFEGALSGEAPAVAREPRREENADEHQGPEPSAPQVVVGQQRFPARARDVAAEEQLEGHGQGEPERADPEKRSAADAPDPAHERHGQS